MYVHMYWCPSTAVEWILKGLRKKGTMSSSKNVTKRTDSWEKQCRPTVLLLYFWVNFLEDDILSFRLDLLKGVHRSVFFWISFTIAQFRGFSRNSVCKIPRNSQRNTTHTAPYRTWTWVWASMGMGIGAVTDMDMDIDMEFRTHGIPFS
jgi:hypothetical protein